MRIMVCVLTGMLAIGGLAGCSSVKKEEGPFSIKNFDVSIVNDAKLTGSTEGKDENGKTKQIVSNSLYYSMDIYKNGRKQLHKPNSEMDVKVIPNDSLVSTSKEVLGYNVFAHTKEGLGTGIGINDFNDKGKGHINLDYELGANEKNDAVPLSPPKDKLEKLRKKAREGDLVLYRNKKEIARYDLKTLKYKESQK